MKSSVFWDTMPCGPLKVNAIEDGFFEPEHICDMFLRTSVGFQRTRRHIPEDVGFHSVIVSLTLRIVFPFLQRRNVKRCKIKNSLCLFKHQDINMYGEW
jgi:hypothetical protein